MLSKFWILLWLGCGLLCAQDVTAIMGATVVDGTGAPPRKANVILRGSKIEAVSPDAAAPAGARVIDASRMTLLPGFFDLHTHLLAPSISGANPDLGKHLKAYLACGVTTVVDFSQYPEQFEPVRKLIREGLVSPRMLVAARLSTPGGHGLEGGRGDLHTQIVQTPREARVAVQHVATYKPDVLKVFTDGWRYGAGEDMTSMDLPTLTALVEEAHRNNLKVLTHTVTVDKAKLAARAGVDVIAHGLGDRPADDELLGLMKARGTWYVQTLAVYEPRHLRQLAGELIRPLLAPDARERLRPDARTSSDQARARRWQNLMANTKIFHDAGMRLAAGTDAGVTGTHHGWASLREIELMVKGGLTPLEAIRAGTLDSARALGIEATTGSVEAGKTADLVLVEGAPHENIAELHRVHGTFFNGRFLKAGDLKQEISLNQMTPLRSLPARALLDDFESADGRSRVDTLWVNRTDSGHDHSKMAWQRTRRAESDHALTLLVTMSQKDNPVAELSLPLAKGGIEPVDVSAFQGIEFEARGDGDYEIEIPLRSVEDRRYHQTVFQAGPSWRKIRVPFSTLTQPGSKSPLTWTGKDAFSVDFRVQRPAGAQAWLEIDNLRFF